ncbi:Bug family tripartite tricarboxylate transporter substrate binding protein [Propionivibrio dicarboxylicus]|uniref:Tripartite-type tricarboxylate transporter, receptor component TctC n=1 Tax=Propionivibrio dicarboxylicus TaxID=83767 RepID=A0A1G8M842_9RHOO|nr:tripartite tricarboxylate transporter substrate binding protein [Propionivibrio dicarboxylicus]SDI63540.1 Tripartite-type tricarboxylate transporter, receptor component TctC [Propionivibrio dicarboxylicus]
MTTSLLSRRTFTRLLAATAVAGLGCFGLAQAQTYPTKPVTLVVPYPAGGANDMLGRLIGQKLSEGLGQQFIIDNKPGAGTLIGATVVAKAPADGYTLLVGGFASNAVSPILFKAEYDPLTAFEPIGLFGTAPMVVITFPNSKYKTLKDVVEAAKAKPGEVMYGSSGNGSPLHLAGEMFTAQAKINLTHVPYKGGSAHILDLIGGRLDVIFDTSTNSTPLIKGGKVRPIAVSSKTRMADFPDVPTFAESGYPDFTVNGWYALYAPAKTPKAIVDRLSVELQKVLKQPEVIEKLRGVGVAPASGVASELAKYGPDEFAKYTKLIKDANIKAD